SSKCPGEVEEAAGVSGGLRVGPDISVIDANLHRVAVKAVGGVGLCAEGIVYGSQAPGSDAASPVLLQIYAGEEAARETNEPQLAPVEFLDVSLKGGLDKSGEPNTRVDQAPWGHSVDPVKYDTVIVSGLRPLSLVGECTLQSVIASEFITVVLVVGAENLMVFGDLVVVADDLGVIVVLALVQGVDEVVEPLTRDVGSREELKNGQRNRIHTIGLKLVVCKRGANQLAIDGLGRQRIVNREWCRLIGVALTEIPCSFSQGRYGCGNREWDSLAEALPGEHEKDLVLNYWAGDRNTELVKLVRRSRGPLLAKPRITGRNFPAVPEPALGVVQRIVCVPGPVPDKVPRPSMKLVAAALERHID